MIRSASALAVDAPSWYQHATPGSQPPESRQFFSGGKFGVTEGVWVVVLEG